MLDYCLEDGQRLVQVSDNSGQKNKRPVVSSISDPILADTVYIPNGKIQTNAAGQEVETVLKNDLQSQIQSKSEKLKITLTDQWYQILQFAPIVLALGHNYWQWLYLSKLTSSAFSDYLFSFQFLFWFLLLISGAIFSIISLKYGRSKSFAVTALVILAINVLLSLVPK